MSGISAIQPLGSGEAWQAVMQAALDAQAPAGAAEALHETAAPALPAAVPAVGEAGPVEQPVGAQLPEPASALLPMAPALLQPLGLRDGTALRERAADVSAWQRLFDATAEDEDGPPPSPDEQADGAAAPDPAGPPPAWVQGLLARLQQAAVAPPSAAALRPALQAWRIGLPVLLASPAGLVSLQCAPEATGWRWRRWPARWRNARPAGDERWWAVRLAWHAPGLPRTVRELAGAAACAPGQVSCELRLDGGPAGLPAWTEVLVQAAAAPSLRALLAARPSLPWVLCNQPLWPDEGEGA